MSICPINGQNLCHMPIQFYDWHINTLHDGKAFTFK